MSSGSLWQGNGEVRYHEDIPEKQKTINNAHKTHEEEEEEVNKIMSASIVKEYASLTPLRHKILQVLAVCETDVGMSTLQSILKSCGWDSAATKSGFLTQAMIKEELSSLREQKLVSSSTQTFVLVAIDRCFLDSVVQQSVLSGNLETIIAAVEPLSERLERDMRVYLCDAAIHTARRRARIAFYRGDVAAFNAAAAVLSEAPAEMKNLSLLNPFNKELYKRTPVELQAAYVVDEASRAIVEGTASAPDASSTTYAA